MAQFVTSVKNTFVHVDVDSPDRAELGSNACRRASSTPPRVKLDTAEKEKSTAHAFGARGDAEALLPPHDDDDYSSMDAHPGPSPLDMDMEGMFGCHIPETDTDDDFPGLSVSQGKDKVTPDFVDAGLDVDVTVGEESASALADQGLTYGAQLPNVNYRESFAQCSPCSSVSPMTFPKTAQRELVSTFPILPHEAQSDSYMRLSFKNSPATELCDAKHAAMQGEEKRTTVMLMNVPLRYTSSKLMRTLESEGFAGMYDFIYVPMTPARNSKGYAFLNWVNPSIAQQFISAFDGFSKWSTASKNVGQAVWAKQHQGLQTNIDRYRNKTVLGKTVPDEYKPRIFENGVEIPFPAPTPKSSKPTPTRRAEKPQKQKTQWTLSL